MSNSGAVSDQELAREAGSWSVKPIPGQKIGTAIQKTDKKSAPIQEIMSQAWGLQTFYPWAQVRPASGVQKSKDEGAGVGLLSCVSGKQSAPWAVFTALLRPFACGTLKFFRPHFLA